MTQVSMVALIAGARAGWLVSFPTDTVPALAVRPDQAQSIFAIKRRDPSKSLILMGATPEALWPFVEGSPEEWQVWQSVAQRYWPGALTLILPASDRVPAQMHPATITTIGLRVPDWPVAQTILQQTGPLATTSANLSGQPPLQDLNKIEQQFPEVLTLLPTEWVLPRPEAEQQEPRAPSTVAKWSGEWKILRQGPVKL